MALRLHNTRILKDGTCCFNFIFEEFSKVKDNVYSRSFFFAGFRWRLQGSVKGGQFGVFLRLFGGGEHTEKVKCKIKFAVEVINNRDPTKSVRAGSMNEADEFPRVLFGIGWSKLLALEAIKKPDSGFLDDSNLFVEIRCKMVHIVFEDKLVINLSSRTNFVCTSKFSLYGSTWYIVLYPRGEPETKTGQQYEYAAAYLHREDPSMLRFKATYSIFVHGGREVQVSHHFCDNNASTAFGIEKFIRTKDLKAISKGGVVSIGVKITRIEPYYYFGFDTKVWSPPDYLGEGCAIEELMSALKPSSNDKQWLDMKLVFDPGPEYRHLDLNDSAYYMKILWSIRVFCFKDTNRSVTVNSWDIPGRSSFCYSQDEISMNTTLQLNEVLNPYSPFLDDEKNLCVRLVIHNANQVYDPLLINPDKHGVAKLREVNAQTKSAVENFWKDQLGGVSTEKDKVIAQKEEEIAEKEEELSKKEAEIIALKDEINENSEYLAEIENTVDEIDGKKVNSIQHLIQEAKPELEEVNKQVEVAEILKAFLMKNLPFSIGRISVVGATGQGTTIKGYKEVDLAVFIKDLPRTEHKTWLRAIVFTIRTLLKQEGSKMRDNVGQDQSSLLPPCSDFNTTSAAVLFKCEDVNVVLMPINDWEPMGGYPALYKLCLSQPADAQFYYNISACERQSEFIALQSEKCKELIRVVKMWSNTVPWRNSSSKPSQYLLSLLVTAAYQVVLEGSDSQAVRANKDVFLELADMVGDDSLEVFWNEFYLSEDYPKDHLPVLFELPIVQDPAIPTHNVAATGLEDWTLFRRELSKWVTKLTL